MLKLQLNFSQAQLEEMLDEVTEPNVISMDMFNREVWASDGDEDRRVKVQITVTKEPMEDE